MLLFEYSKNTCTFDFLLKIPIFFQPKKAFLWGSETAFRGSPTSRSDELISWRRREIRRCRESVQQPVVIRHWLLLVTGQSVNVMPIWPFWCGKLEVRRHLRCQHHNAVKCFVPRGSYGQVICLVRSYPERVRYVDHLGNRCDGSGRLGTRVARVAARCRR